VFIGKGLPMQLVGRSYQCARCLCPVVICSRCDRGNRYCPGGCAKQARRDSLRRAAARYQRTRQGRFSHAARQQRYRARQRQKVTHQGSTRPALDAPLLCKPAGGGHDGAVAGHEYARCAFCAAPLASVWLRPRHGIAGPTKQHRGSEP
jgi:hypothetical protein